MRHVCHRASPLREKCKNSVFLNKHPNGVSPPPIATQNVTKPPWQLHFKMSLHAAIQKYFKNIIIYFVVDISPVPPITANARDRRKLPSTGPLASPSNKFVYVHTSDPTPPPLYDANAKPTRAEAIVIYLSQSAAPSGPGPSATAAACQCCDAVCRIAPTPTTPYHDNVPAPPGMALMCNDFLVCSDCTALAQEALAEIKRMSPIAFSLERSLHLKVMVGFYLYLDKRLGRRCARSFHAFPGQVASNLTFSPGAVANLDYFEAMLAVDPRAWARRLRQSSTRYFTATLARKSTSPCSSRCGASSRLA